MTDIAAPERPVSLQGLRVLVVEDNPVNLSILVQSLTDAGAVVEGVADGKTALRRVEELRGKLTLILLDVTLPDIDGIEVARRIRASETGDEPLLIIGLTAHVGSMIHGAGLAAGMNQVLTKPIRPSQLRRALRDAWEGTALANQPKTETDTHTDRVGAERGWLREKEMPMLLDDTQVQEITDDMGRDLALSFMRRALAEAREVYLACQQNIPTVELRSRIHSSIGSAGLTGLAAVEAALRGLQDHSRRNLRDSEAEAALDLALEQTEERLTAFAKGE